ncbi:MAG TPA: type II toxin-antitoxin system HipA family toxin [Prolixibacteraceae bacterium]|nr:type II toxin-antitoxin system HipA family toxin [Prolixibacteraceae bacterium]
MNVKRIKISLNLANKPLEAGELAVSGKDIYFKYYDSFLRSGLNISPIKLPFTNEIQKADRNLFEGLFGVFFDSLPDSWGKLLLDRKLMAMGLDPLQTSPLDRLSFVGVNGLGALEYQPINEDLTIDKHIFDLDKISSESQHLITGADSEILEELYVLGGSSGGARPKINVWVNEANKEISSNNKTTGDQFEPWIIKFPTLSDKPDIANIEYAYMLMAKAAGIETADCMLFQGKSGKFYFGTKRFDRCNGEKLHMHSASGLLHDDHRYSQMDYGHLMDCAFQLEKSVSGHEKVLRLAAFNVYSHNRDDHSKNFSFLMDKTGKWKLSPAYDLTFSSSSYGHHNTTIAGESFNPGFSNLMELAHEFKVNNAKTIIDEVKTTVACWSKFAEEAGVNHSSKKLINKTIQYLIKS